MASPTVNHDSVMITGAVDAMENQTTWVMDCPGAFLYYHCEDSIMMKAELTKNVAPETYRKYIDIDGKGRPILYVKLQKTLYRMFKSALLLYKKMLADLTGK